MEVPEQVATPLSGTVRLLRRTAQELGKDDYAGLAAQMTYYFMLGLFPLLILLVGLLDALPLDRDSEAIVQDLIRGLPDGIAVLLGDFLRDFATRRPTSGLLLWAVPALWAASRAVGGARKGLDRILEAPAHGPHPLRRRLRDLGMTLVAVLALSVGYVLMIGGEQLLRGIGQLTGPTEAAARLNGWILLPLLMALGTAIVAALYRLLPARKLPWPALFAGALPVVLLWTALTGALRLWVRALSGFDVVYGSLASFFVLMMLVWVYSLTLLLGGELAQRVAQRTSAS